MHFAANLQVAITWLMFGVFRRGKKGWIGNEEDEITADENLKDEERR